jgi:hypothetical protein
MRNAPNDKDESAKIDPLSPGIIYAMVAIVLAITAAVLAYVEFR